MKVKVEQVKNAGIQAGMATAGFIGGNVVNSLGRKAAPAKLKVFVAPATIAVGMGIAILAKQSAAQAFGVGVAANGMIRTVNHLTAPSIDAQGNSIAQSGVKAMISQYVPSLNGIGMGNTDYQYAEYPSYEETPLLMGVESEAAVSEEWM